MKTFDRITFDPQKMGGQACIRSLRVPVSVVVSLVAHGMTTAEILKDYPYLEAADIQQALAYAAWVTSEKILPAHVHPVRRLPFAAGI